MTQVQAPEPKITEDKLLALLRSEQTRDSGFRLLMQAYQERLYLHIRRMVGEHEDANDVLQNCLVKVYRNIGSFKAQSALYTWLYRIATNEAMTFLRKRQRHVNKLQPEDEATAGRQLRADAWMDGEAVQEHLQRALETLPDRQKQVFVMRYYDELSYAEIAGILKTSVGGLKASYHHAVKKIEHYLINTII
ncbi:RNA polymerase sigma factor [Flavilitoribacter nigricans]|nr:RNA polymerase sigma factor [Flavilitoribacter nigricans]